jgi:hypothetical protein
LIINLEHCITTIVDNMKAHGVTVERKQSKMIALDDVSPASITERIDIDMLVA